MGLGSVAQGMRARWLGVACIGGALATRFVPFRENGEWHLWPTVLAVFIWLVAIVASLYLVTLLEILKLRRLRAWVGRPREEEDEPRLKSA